ncbi:PKD domain-containing protein [Maribacter sp. 2210JD10-5]|uniref:PKD domain-containing protein n=1 Tax=Maribacter sp. 2210JD10-5 TaxID=3386272 RepID=UPI0039BD4ADD
MRNRILKYIKHPVLGGLILTVMGISCSREYSVSEGIKPVEFKATASTQLITVGETVTFIDSSLAVASRRWLVARDTIDDIVTSDQETFEVTYNTPSPKAGNGDFLGLPVNLQVTFEDGRVEDNVFGVTVYPRISLDFETNLETAIVGSTINFTNLSTDFESEFEEAQELDEFQWEFPGGSPSSSMEANPSVIYTTAGTYDVIIRARRQGPEDEAVLTRIGAITIVNELDLVPDFTADVTEISAEQSVTFTDATTGGADDYLWTFAGGTPETSTEQNPAVLYTSGGFYDVTLQVTRDADGTVETITKSGFINVDSPFCNTPENLVGCGNNDGEGNNLVDWNAQLEPGKGDPRDRNDNLSISTEQAFAGTGSIKYSYSEPGAAAFTGILIDYSGKLVDVTEQGAYQVSMQHYGTVTGGVEYVFLFGVVNSETGEYINNFEGRFPADTWNSVSKEFNLPPGKYYIRTQLFNPGFNPTQSIDLYMDDLTIVQN